MANYSSAIPYHLAELEIANDPGNPKRILPTLTESDQVILDVGCGIGQSFVAMDCLDRTCFGVDIDTEAVDYGKSNYGERIQYFVAGASELPVESDTVDLLMSRVTLPRAVEEAARVLRPGGRVWLTLHSPQMVFGWLKRAVRDRAPRAAMQRTYAILNGYAFKYLGVIFPYRDGTYENWQDPRATLRLFAKHGFDAQTVEAGQHLLVTGQLSK